MCIHRPGQEERSIVWRVELVTQDVNGRNPFDVVLCAEVRGQKTSKLNQRVVALREE